MSGSRGVRPKRIRAYIRGKKRNEWFSSIAGEWLPDGPPIEIKIGPMLGASMGYSVFVDHDRKVSLPRAETESEKHDKAFMNIMGSHDKAHS